jgi:hypothetical protein
LEKVLMGSFDAALASSSAIILRDEYRTSKLKSRDGALKRGNCLSCKRQNWSIEDGRILSFKKTKICHVLGDDNISFWIYFPNDLCSRPFLSIQDIDWAKDAIHNDTLDALGLDDLHPLYDLLLIDFHN